MKAHMAQRGKPFKSNSFWVAVLCGILAVCAAAAFALNRTPAQIALIYLDGRIIESFDLSGLSQPITLTVEAGTGFNAIDIERGRIRVSEADCPDGFCVRQGWVHGGAVPIVCLPHRLVIRFEGGGMPDVDAVAG